MPIPDGSRVRHKHLASAVRVQPESVPLVFGLGVTMAGVTPPRRRSPCFEQAIRLQPGFAVAHFQLAVALAAVGRTEEARAQHDRARQLDPSLPLLVQVVPTAEGTAKRRRRAQKKPVVLFFALLRLLAAIGLRLSAIRIRSARLRSVFLLPFSSPFVFLPRPDLRLPANSICPAICLKSSAGGDCR